MARKKENSAAARLSQPSSRPPAIVAPERDTPGIIARHWTTPMPRAVGSGRAKASRQRPSRPRRSRPNSATPPISSDQQISRGLSNSTVLMKWCRARPSTAAGRKAIRMLSTNRRAPGSCGSRRKMVQNRLK